MLKHQLGGLKYSGVAQDQNTIRVSYLSENIKAGEQSSPHYEGGIPIFPGEAERQAAAKLAEEAEEREYKSEQAAIQKGLLGTQIGLVVFGVIGILISGYQSFISRRAADTAVSALNENRRQFEAALEETKAQTRAQVNAADASRKAADESIAALEVSKQQFKQSLRETQVQTQAQVEAAKATRDAAETAAGQLELTERPWIRILDAQTPSIDQSVPALVFAKNGYPHASLNLTMRLKNIGHSVAFVTAYPTLVFPRWDKGGMDRLLADERALCSAEAQRGVDSISKTMIYPDDDPFEWQGVTGSGINQDAIMHPDVLNGSEGIMLALIVCVDYRFEPSPKTYQTRAIFLINRVNDGSFFKLGEDLSGDRLKFVRQGLADDAY